MEKVTRAIEALSPFLASYPTWVRAVFAAWVAATAILMLSLLLARRTNVAPSRTFTPDDSAATAGPPPAYIWLHIKGVTVYDVDEDVAVRVTGTINGNIFVYPSGTEAEWIRVGPNMSPQKFKVPYSKNGYSVRYSMLARAKDRTLKFISQWTEPVTTLPFVKPYHLHAFDPESKTRDSKVGATIEYALTVAEPTEK